MHPLRRFWSAAYAPFVQAGGAAFHVPPFPFALTSPYFWNGVDPVPAEALHLNLLGEGDPPPGFTRHQRFAVGAARARALPGVKSSAVVLPLADALALAGYRELLAEAFPHDQKFLRSFLPFLSTLPARSRTILLGDPQLPAAALTLVMAGGVGLCLNAAVAAPQRGRGLSRRLVEECHLLAVAEAVPELIFWTEHAFLLPHAESLVPYQVFVRAN